MWAVGFRELVCDDLGAIGAAIVNDDEFPVEVSVGLSLSRDMESDWTRILFGEGAVEQPCNDGQVATLVVCRKDDGVFVFGRGIHDDEKVAKERKK